MKCKKVTCEDKLSGFMSGRSILAKTNWKFFSSSSAMAGAAFYEELAMKKLVLDDMAMLWWWQVWWWSRWNNFMKNYIRPKEGPDIWWNDDHMMMIRMILKVHKILGRHSFYESAQAEELVAKKERCLHSPVSTFIQFTRWWWCILRWNMWKSMLVQQFLGYLCSNS